MADSSTGLTTPDGRYIVVRGRLWRRANPGLSEHERARLTRDLMDARRAVGRLKRSGVDPAPARAAVDRAYVNGQETIDDYRQSIGGTLIEWRVRHKSTAALPDG